MNPENTAVAVETERLDIVKRITDQEYDLKNEEAAAESRIAESVRDVQARVRQLDELRKLAASSEGMGVPNPVLMQRIDMAITELAAMQAEVEADKKRLEQANSRLEAMAGLKTIRRVCREILKEPTAPLIESYDDVLGWAHLELKFSEGVASIVEATWFAENRIAHRSTFTIRAAEPRVGSCYVPKELNWIPNEWRGGTNGGQSAASVVIQPGEQATSFFYCIGQERAIAPWRSSVVHSFTRRDYNHGREVDVPVQETIDLLTDPQPIEDFLKSRLSEKVVDLDTESGDAFLDGIAEAVREATQPFSKSGFARCERAHSRAEIDKEIGAEWKAFIDSPWTPDHTDALAKLKYLCESGERARFFSLGVAGHFGFRIRTRDHTWITGSVFKDPKGASRGPDLAAEVKRNYSNPMLVRFRGLTLKVDGERRD